MSQIAAGARLDDAIRTELERSTVRAISWRLIPFLVLAYFFSYLDRVNLGFAALTMNRELNITPLIYSWGAGIFFIGYFIFEVPSNLALEKFGASRWIARIMVTWGIISALMALTVGEWSFYILRFLLGVAEAGFFPGIILYLTYWYPAEYRARFLALFAIAVPVSTVIGAPVSGLLLGLGRHDILARLPAIREFSELGDFFEQPIATYSAGMGTRLAFAGAIQVDPDVLLIDEVLAVGDAEFQEKSGAAMRARTGEGSTIVLVSHDEEQIAGRCDRVLWIEHGKSVLEGSRDQVFAAYRRDQHIPVIAA